MLSPFCRNLTHIRQEDVDSAPRFAAAFKEFRAWTAPFAPFTLGASGRPMTENSLRADCQRHNVLYPFTNYLNLKETFARASRTREGRAE